MLKKIYPEDDRKLIKLPKTVAFLFIGGIGLWGGALNC